MALDKGLSRNLPSQSLRLMICELQPVRLEMLTDHLGTNRHSKKRQSMNFALQQKQAKKPLNRRSNRMNKPKTYLTNRKGGSDENIHHGLLNALFTDARFIGSR